MAKPKEKIEARDLRRKGESIKEIAFKLKVSSSTVSIWCRDILLTPNQIKKLEKRAHDPYYGRRGIYLSKLKKERERKEKELLEKGRAEISELTERDLFVCGVVLYWAEGFKKESLAGFANSDPRMIKLFLRWLRESCHIPESHIKPRIGLNESHKYRIGDIEKYWSKVTAISLERFQKPFYQKVKWVKQYENPEEYFGVLRIRIAKSTDFLRKIHGWISGVSEAGSRLVSKDVS